MVRVVGKEEVGGEVNRVFLQISVYIRQTLAMRAQFDQLFVL